MMCSWHFGIQVLDLKDDFKDDCSTLRQLETEQRDIGDVENLSSTLVYYPGSLNSINKDITL